MGYIYDYYTELQDKIAEEESNWLWNKENEVKLYKWYCVSKNKKGDMLYDIIEARSLTDARDKLRYLPHKGFLEELCIMRTDTNMQIREDEWRKN